MWRPPRGARGAPRRSSRSATGNRPGAPPGRNVRSPSGSSCPERDGTLDRASSAGRLAEIRLRRTEAYAVAALGIAGRQLPAAVRGLAAGRGGSAPLRGERVSGTHARAGQPGQRGRGAPRPRQAVRGPPQRARDLPVHGDSGRLPSPAPGLTSLAPNCPIGAGVFALDVLADRHRSRGHSWARGEQGFVWRNPAICRSGLPSGNCGATGAHRKPRNPEHP